MKISLKQLDHGFPALQKLAQKPFPAEQHKLKYRISRIYKSAKNEIEEMHASLADLLNTFGVVHGELNPDPVKLAQFRRAERTFLKETTLELWGDSIPYAQLIPYIETPADLADLDWLIVPDAEMQAAGWSGQTDPEKSLTAQS